ncbi:ankyrin [Annulohypoxylon maeteangense]|uniref:ankyrin n=1 Tax=Annulohypoxylon maeteangense TaxID=1927788 RepID=UPI0020087835|nr:ankyrin [Annulohypoxylon maeteangense]KAI0881479.1 ankyrin [Annulohypoxylon maeteangense]
MDPLSGVSSIFAVISLAIQLGKNAIELIKFIDSIHDAPAEIIRLNQVVRGLQSIDNDVRNALECQKDSYGQNNVNICTALERCQANLNSIKGIFHIAEKMKNGKTSLVRNFAQARLAYKKDEIERFERQLNNSITALHVHLSLNLIRSWVQQGATETRLIPPRMPRLSEIAIHKTLLKGSWFHIYYHKLSGKYRRQSVLLQARICRSYMIMVHLWRPFLGMGYSLPFNLSIRGLIPPDSEILEACKKGNSCEVRRLLSLGSTRPDDVTPDNRTLLSIAIEEGHAEIVHLLLREGADPNSPFGRYERSPLQHGIFFGRLDIIRTLISRGADPDYCSAQGWSLLHYLFDRTKSITSIECFSILGGDMIFDDIKDGRGWTSLHRCAAFGNADDIRFLNRIGASAFSDRYITNDGYSPIHVAAVTNNVSTLEELFEIRRTQLPPQIQKKGITDILDLVDTKGWTPLHLAAYSGSVSTLKWLLLNGANPHCTTYRTADWFPEGHEGEAFEVADLVLLSKGNCLEAFIETLRKMEYDVTTDGNDIYWLSADQSTSQES